MENKYDIYICCSLKDNKVVTEICHFLDQQGLSYWIDRRDIVSGEAFAQSVVKAIQRSELFLFIISESSGKSKYCINELDVALQYKKHVFPLMIDYSDREMLNELTFLIGDIRWANYFDKERWQRDLLFYFRNYNCTEREGIDQREKSYPNSQRPKSNHSPSPEAPKSSRTSFVVKVLKAPFSIIAKPISIVVSAIKEQKKQNKQNQPGTTFSPEIESLHDSDKTKVYSSVFAPAEVRRGTALLVQVYLHISDEAEMVKSLAQESQKNAKRRDYIPLQCKLKEGDKVDVQLDVYGETLLRSEKRIIIWQGTFTKCSIAYFIPRDINVDELCCAVLFTVNEIPVGEMQFVTKIVDYEPRKLNPDVIAHKYSKVFVSYSHLDESKVKFLHEGLELGDVPHFFDRKYLKAGDVFPQVIQDYINSADLFILCWSENASKSEYVQRERLQALERAFPQVKPEQKAKLRIYPISIEPRAELPNDMKENYHFGEI